jgi:hypothetical protein
MQPFLLTCALCAANVSPGHFVAVAVAAEADANPPPPPVTAPAPDANNPDESSDPSQMPALGTDSDPILTPEQQREQEEAAREQEAYESHKEHVAAAKAVALVSLTAISLGGIAAIGQVRNLGIGRLYIDLGAEFLGGATGLVLSALACVPFLDRGSHESELLAALLIVTSATLLGAQGGVAIAELLGKHDFNPGAHALGALGMLLGGVAVLGVSGIVNDLQSPDDLGVVLVATCGPLLIAGLGINGFAALAHR